MNFFAGLRDVILIVVGILKMEIMVEGFGPISLWGAAIFSVIAGVILSYIAYIVFDAFFK